MRRIGFIFVLCFCLGRISAQQQTVYSNILMNQYLYNPAYAGVDDGTRISLSHRNQWMGFEGAPVTNIASGYGKLKKKPMMAVGGMVMTERMGLLQRTFFYGTYSYILKINKKASINFGLGVGGVQHRVRIYDARPYDKDDSFFSNQVLNGFAFDANAGAYLYSKNFFLGFSNQHMPNAKILWKNSLGRLTSHFYVYSGYNFHIAAQKEWVIQPSILVRTNSPAPYQLEFMLRGVYREMVWAGLSYRQGSAMSGMFGCNINKQFMLGYAYDFTLTEISRYSNGTHEIMLSYLMPFKKKKSKSEQIQDADEEELNKIDNSLKTNLRNKRKQEKENKGESENKSGNEQQKTGEPQGEQKENPETVPQGEQENQQGQEGATEQPTELKPETSTETPSSELNTDQGKPEEGENKSAAEEEKTQIAPDNSQPAEQKPDINGAESQPAEAQPENSQQPNNTTEAVEPQTNEEPK